MSELFRREALEAKKGSWLGDISLSQPVRLWVLSCFGAMAAVAVVSFVVLGEYSRRSRVSGELVPDLGLSTVVAPAAGVVAALEVDEGDHVKRRTPLLLINVPRVTAAGEDTLAVLRQGLDTRLKSLGNLRDSQDAQLQVQLAGLQQQRAAMRLELRQIDDEVASRGEQVRIAKEIVERYRQVSDQRYVSLVQLNQQEQAALELVNAQQSLQRQATSIRRNIAKLDQSIAEIPQQRRSARATSERTIAELADETVQVEANGEMSLTAPVAGLVASRLVEVGQAVQPGQPMLSLLPEGSELRAQLLVPSAAIGFVKPGDQVLLRYKPYPYQKFGSHSGKVIRISRSAVPAQTGQGQSTEPVYRILVALDSQSVQAYGVAEPLRPGMIVDADIMGEKRRLYEWMLEPLYSISGQIGG
jgi:membrane fusion protein